MATRWRRHSICSGWGDELSGFVWLGAGLWCLLHAGGAHRCQPAAYSTLLFPLVALTLSTLYEGYQWHSNAIVGLVMILAGNMVMFVRWPAHRRLRLA